MAHYGLGVVLSQNEVIDSDSFGGLTNKLFKSNWLMIRIKLMMGNWLEKVLRV